VQNSILNKTRARRGWGDSKVANFSKDKRQKTKLQEGKSHPPESFPPANNGARSSDGAGRVCGMLSINLMYTLSVVKIVSLQKSWKV
jgi:hypothetical protein